MPFITEELWAQTADNGAARTEPLLIGAAWPELADSLIDTEAAAEVSWLIETVEAVRSLKGEMSVATA
ncbi:MAG TPA: hypothetical protein DCL55_07120, partial [Brevundimonas sp.]|nr:hypothetical protein [Brevundimonas sp.]